MFYTQHIPVLRQEVIGILNPQPGETVLDVTLGLGGHAAQFLQTIGPEGMLIGLDADSGNLEGARKRLESWDAQTNLQHANFRDIGTLALPQADIIFADLGLSSPHLDDTERGFSFREDAPLDMRFDRTKGERASDLIANSSEQRLTEIFRTFGELRGSRRFAVILKERLPQTTWALKAATETAFGYRAKPLLPQVFQALRIAVNDELSALEILLSEGPRLLKHGGRMGVISFHSLEDRMVKTVFRALSTPEKDPLTGGIAKQAPFRLLTKKPIVPSEKEIAENPRSRSAKFRAILKD